MKSTLQKSIDRQRDILKGWLSASLVNIADDCKQRWPDRQALEARLMEGMAELPYCKYLYLLDERAHQITSNASRDGLLESQYGRDRSERPYLASALAGAPFSLSDAYISRNARRPSLTAVQLIRADDGRLLGYLGADFDLRELPATQALYQQPDQWMQLKGDPAIRSGLFHQVRATSPMDEHIDEVLDLLAELITVNGIFHAKLHFSSSRATLWTVEDPYRFRIHGIDELTNPDLCLAYPRRDYPADAAIPAEAVARILSCFRDLRFMDETIYLRSGMLNIFNGLIGLTFSCDGSHYMPWEEFLDKNLGFWLGTSGEASACL
ncbi:MAG: PDC sensor domain-containing protein [Gammaproteobacteria bacterium]